MGGALLGQWVRSTQYAFTVVDPGLESVPPNARLVRDADALGEAQFDTIIVAVKPQLIDAVLPAYAGRLSESGLIVSIAAGYSADRFRDIFAHAPVIRLMPNLAAAVGKGVNGLFATPDVSAEDRADIVALMSLTGISIWVGGEDELDRVTVIASSGVGFFFEIARSFVAASERLGFNRNEARDLVLGAFAGAAELARQSDLDLETLRNNVTSKQGVTLAGLDQLRRDGMLDGLSDRTLQAAYARAIELR